MSQNDDDEARKIVLARRARFVAAAVASVGVACRSPSAEACLSPPPEPCLSVVRVDPTADAGTTDAAPPSKVTAEPQVCLKVRATPREEDDAPFNPGPAPCLSVAPTTRPDAGAKPIPLPCLSPLPPPPPKPKPSP